MKELFSMIVRIIIMSGVWITFAICAAVIVLAVVILIKDKLSYRETKRKT